MYSGSSTTDESTRRLIMSIYSKYDEMICLFEELKSFIKKNDPHNYERWKAGGYLINDDIASMYPHLGELVEQYEDEDEDSAITEK